MLVQLIQASYKFFFQPKKLKIDFTKIEIFGFDFNNRFYQILQTPRVLVMSIGKKISGSNLSYFWFELDHLFQAITRSLSNIEESLFSIIISLIFGRDFSLLAWVHKCENSLKRRFKVGWRGGGVVRGVYRSRILVSRSLSI